MKELERDDVDSALLVERSRDGTGEDYELRVRLAADVRDEPRPDLRVLVRMRPRDPLQLGAVEQFERLLNELARDRRLVAMRFRPLLELGRVRPQEREQAREPGQDLERLPASPFLRSSRPATELVLPPGAAWTTRIAGDDRHNANATTWAGRNVGGARARPSRAAISRIERGLVSPSVATLAQLFDLMGEGARPRRRADRLLLDAETLRRGANFTFERRWGSLDILGDPSGGPPYDQLRDGAGTPVRIEGERVTVASLDHPIAMKEASGRRKDRLMATEYRVISDELRAPRHD